MDNINASLKPLYVSSCLPVTAPTSTKKGGLNWGAIFIMLMMGLPALITLSITAYDYFYPHQAVLRAMRTRLERCYSLAKPGEVVDVDKIMKKYEGKEDILFSILRNKYPKFGECQ